MGADDYYYSDGKKIPLEPDPEHVALSAPRASATGTSTRRGKTLGRALVGDVRLVPASEVPIGAKQAGGDMPVFKAGGQTVVVLPEVRVELASGQRKALDRVLKD